MISMRGVTKRIQAIKFALLSPDECRRMSATKIITADTYDDDGFPIDMGLMDSHLGVIEPGLRCKTCGGKVDDCPGHFGHIDLAMPVIHVGYVKDLKKLLQATCRRCGRLLLTRQQAMQYMAEMEQVEELGGDLTEVGLVTKETAREATKRQRCPHCGEEQGKITLDKPTTFREDGHKLTPREVRERLERIPNEDLRVLGMNPEVARPEWMVLTALLVPPVTVRPSITLESGDRSEDDLTHKLVDVLRINQRLRENRDAGAPQLIVEDLWELLQYHITTYFDNQTSGIPPARHRSGRPLKTLVQRLKGKEGRFRSNLSGKRVNFSARTVISPDPILSINEVGVPVEAARELTVPVHVQAYNMDIVKLWVKRGPTPSGPLGEYLAGVNYVIRPDGRRIRVTDKNAEVVAEAVEVGYTVERQLVDGDIVLFNRQPSLHRMSMMAHEVRVMPHKTFRFNLAVCVAGDTKVDVGGISRPIAQLRNCWKESSVATYDWTHRRLGGTELSAFWALKPKDFGLEVFRIRTRSGLELTATGDHPIYTERGMVPCVEVSVGERVIVRPEAYPAYDEREFVILTQEDFVRRAPPGTYIGHAVRELTRRELLPLRSLNQPRAIAVAKLLGHVFGDGTLIVKGSNPRAVFRADREDLEAIRRDLHSVGFPPGKLIENSGGGIIHPVSGKDIPIHGQGWSLEVRSKPFCSLLYALGAPAGDKPTFSYRVPRWLRSRGAPLQLRKAFLASYFGSELSIPAVRRRNPGKFRDPVFKVSKVEGLEHAGKTFIRDIDSMLRSFGSGIVSVASSGGNIRRDGSRTVVLSARVRSGSRDLANVYGRVGYEYNERAEGKARIAYAYLKDASSLLRRRADALRRVRPMAGWPRNRIKAVALASGIPASTLCGWRSRRTKPLALRIPSNHPSIEDWIRRSVYDRDAGLIFDAVVAKEPADASQVYDITTTAGTHTFFANGILTGNCPPYNADFDGDEMNLHVLQSEEARAEARVLMRVQEHILSPRFGGPVIGGIHDHITGSFLLTHKDSRFTREEVTHILTKIDVREVPSPQIKKGGEEYWTGKQLFSMILPKDLSMTFKSSIAPKGEVNLKDLRDEDSLVVIKDGVISAGTIDENAVGAFKGKILDKIARDYGADAAREFIDHATKLAIGAIMIRGFTTGIDDEDIPDEAKKQIADVLKTAVEKVEGLVEAYKRGELEQMPGRSLEETLEVEAMKVLGRARDQAGQIAGKHLGINNSAVIMARSGARGSMLNLSQMAGCIGQQAVRGERLSRGYWNRTLPHFRKGDLGAEAKGFVKASYKSGLHPTEYFFHAMGGREGLVDTAVRTSRSGYMQRRLINALEDLKVKEDGTVRNTANTIIQFRFGEDGVDPSRSVQGHAVDIDDILQEVLGEEPSWKERLREQEMASYGLTEKDMYVEITEEEVEVEEEEPSTEE